MGPKDCFTGFSVHPSWYFPLSKISLVNSLEDRMKSVFSYVPISESKTGPTDPSFLSSFSFLYSSLVFASPLSFSFHISTPSPFLFFFLLLSSTLTFFLSPLFSSFSPFVCSFYFLSHPLFSPPTVLFLSKSTQFLSCLGNY